MALSLLSLQTGEQLVDVAVRVGRDNITPII